MEDGIAGEDTGWVALAGKDDGSYYVAVRKINGIVYIIGYSYNIKTVDKNWLRYTLPDWALPDVDIVGFSFNGLGSTISGMSSNVDRDNKVVQLYATSSHSYWAFSVSYPAQQK